MSENKDTDQLIEELSSELKPVKSVLSPLKFITPWLIITAAYLAGIVHFIGVRMDISSKMGDAGEF